MWSSNLSLVLFATFETVVKRTDAGGSAEDGEGRGGESACVWTYADKPAQNICFALKDIEKNAAHSQKWN